MRVLHFAALASRPSASSISRAAPDSCASWKMRSMFFSVSPMYLLTTRDRSIRRIWTPRAARDGHRGHRLAGPARAVKQRGDAKAIGKLIAELPAFKHLGAKRMLSTISCKLAFAVGRQDHVLELKDRLDALRKPGSAFGGDVLAAP